jgi:hypothetical protein
MSHETNLSPEEKVAELRSEVEEKRRELELAKKQLKELGLDYDSETKSVKPLDKKLVADYNSNPKLLVTEDEHDVGVIEITNPKLYAKMLEDIELFNKTRTAHAQANSEQSEALERAIWDYLWTKENKGKINGYMERLMDAFPEITAKAKKTIRKVTKKKG